MSHLFLEASIAQKLWKSWSEVVTVLGNYKPRLYYYIVKWKPPEVGQEKKWRHATCSSQRDRNCYKHGSRGESNTSSFESQCKERGYIIIVDTQAWRAARDPKRYGQGAHKQLTQYNKGSDCTEGKEIKAEIEKEPGLVLQTQDENHHEAQTNHTLPLTQGQGQEKGQWQKMNNKKKERKEVDVPSDFSCVNCATLKRKDSDDCRRGLARRLNWKRKGRKRRMVLDFLS
ncbi:hypothetical protein H5410_030335 [Solanum commersonii]|uniref:Uncharacterized protein n=1 Tax=Solanum commersonii TaxID=4109 RepID=A0A9J5YFW2_SOLCO|nr:hypothetical protein H5410_030335 [Solanum commersonii]